MSRATDARYELPPIDYVDIHAEASVATADRVWDDRIRTIWAAVVGCVAFTGLFRWMHELAAFAGFPAGAVVGIGSLGAVAIFVIYVIMEEQFMPATAIAAIGLAFGAAAGHELRPHGPPTASQALVQMVADRAGTSGCQRIEPSHGFGVIAELSCNANGDGSVTVVYGSFATGDAAQEAFSRMYHDVTAYRYSGGSYVAEGDETIWVSDSAHVVVYVDGGPTGLDAISTWWGGA